MSRPTLQHLQVADLIANAGGDPWAIDDSLQAGSPTQINFLAQAFHQAAGSATAAEQTFQNAQQHFQQYNRENGEQPINNGAEVARVKDGLHATNAQLGQIAADLETIAAALAQARATSDEDIKTLNANLQEYDQYLDDYLTHYDEYRHCGYDIDAYIRQCQAGAATDTLTVFNNVTLIRTSYSKSLQQALTNLRVNDGYDPDVAVRRLDADDTAYGADGGEGAASGTPDSRTSTDGTDGSTGGATNGTASGVDGGSGGMGGTAGANAHGTGGDGGAAVIPPWLAPPRVPGMLQPRKPKTPSEPLIIFDGEPLGNVGDGLKAAADEADRPWIRSGRPVSGTWDEIGRFGRAFGWGGVALDASNAAFDIDARMNDGASFTAAVADVAPEAGGGIVGGWAGAGMGAEAGGEVGALIGSFIVPGAGTAVGAIAGAGLGAFVGGVAGSRLGSAVGETASNVSHGVWHSLFG